MPFLEFTRLAFALLWATFESYINLTKEGGINYDENTSKNGRKIRKINKHSMHDIVVGTSTKNASFFNKKRLISKKQKFLNIKINSKKKASI